MESETFAANLYFDLSKPAFPDLSFSCMKRSDDACCAVEDCMD